MACESLCFSASFHEFSRASTRVLLDSALSVSGANPTSRVAARQNVSTAKYGFFAVLTFCLAATLLVGFAPDTDKAESNKTRVLALENSWNEAEKHNDSHAIDALLSPSFAYTDSDGTFMNKQQFLASVSTLTYQPDQIVNENMNAWAHDRAVIVTGTYRE